MNRSLADALRDVRDHAGRGREYAGETSREALGRPCLERDALLYCLIAIGEALKQVPLAVLSAEPEIPWHAVVAPRNYLAHNYWEIDGDVLWRIARVELAVLIDASERLAARFGESAP